MSADRTQPGRRGLQRSHDTAACAHRSLRVVSALVATAAVVALPGPTFAAASTPNPIQLENQLPGTTSWIVPSPDQAQIAGYTGRWSYLPGDRVTLYVNSGGDPFSYRVYRMGWYQGTGGRLVLTGPGSIRNPPQPASTVTGDQTNGAKLLQTNWTPSASFNTGTGWVSGFYVIVLADAITGAESYASFTLRATDPAAIVVNLATNTWESYNRWGGLSLYADLRPPQPGVAPTEAHQVSALRPWSEGAGAGQFFTFDLPLIEWLEQQGYPVSYATDWDAQQQVEAGPRTRLVIMSGHSEYQTASERRYLWGLPARGVSLAIFGGNSWAWQERFDGATGVLTNWRAARLDPVKGANATLRFEQLGLPQNQFSGAMQTWNTATGKNRAFGQSHWAWNGAGVADGSWLPDVTLGDGEFDGVVANTTSPSDLTVLSRQQLQPLTGRFWGTHPSAYQTMTIRDLPNGAFVFNAGTLSFNDDLAFPSLPGVTDPNVWEDTTRAATSSLVSPAVERLVGNLIAHATGIPNPIPAMSTPPAIDRPLQIVTPDRFPVEVGSRLVVEYALPPAGTAVVRVVLDGRPVGTASPTTGTWTGATGLVATAGLHTLTLAAYSVAGGQLLVERTRTFQALPASAAVFHYPHNIERPYAGVVARF
ncbi:MAG TPA: N,N-dimethylformamidase beta subunit family domain-containing protein [Gaiellales bacterium]|nr:N,N-dimethylformamidase beta subunit family domain-containing protein [Gaiellales bacterium]